MLRRDPLALVDTVGGGRQLVAAACERAAAGGVRPGMTLAQARAVCPSLAHAPHDPEQDLRALARLGRWLTRFTPAVSPAPPDALHLDVGGCERLYGGLDALVARVAGALAALKIGVRLAVAPTPGAAWAVASYGESGTVVQHEGLADALAPLPPAALRLDPATSAMLGQLGVQTVGQLLSLPRDALPARFGVALLNRIDQAFGRVAEPLTPLAHHAAIEARMEFDGTVDSLEAVWQVFRVLLARLVPQLTRRGLGAREVQAEFRRAYAPPVVRAVHLSRPSRDPVSLFNLLRCMFDAVGTDEGFTAIRLAVPVAEPLGDGQLLLLEREEQSAAEELARLIELLGARLGRGSLVCPKPVESHLPERAYRLDEPDSVRPAKIIATGGVGSTAAGARPLCLLARPVEVTAVVSPSHDADGPPLSFTHGHNVHRLVHVDGPERIAGVWWEGRDKTRDYFDAEDESGRRFWLFRVVQTGRWFLHGVFE